MLIVCLFYYFYHFNKKKYMEVIKFIIQLFSKDKLTKKNLMKNFEFHKLKMKFQQKYFNIKIQHNCLV